MIKQILKNTFIALLFSLISNSALAATGDLFKITSTGVGGAPVNITLCLNIREQHPLSCQNYTTQAGTLSFNTTTPNHTYHYVGIKINTTGYVYNSTQGLKTNASPLANDSEFTLVCPSGVNSFQTCSGTITATTTTTTVYMVGGSISDLKANGLVLLNNGTNNLAIDSGATSFQFSTPIASGSSYAVTIGTQPTGLTCIVNNGSGTIANTNITNVSVSCKVNTYTIGGTVSGLTASRLVLLNNEGDNLAVASGSTSFQFSTPVAYGATYAVTILTQPTGLACTVNNGAGTNVTADINKVSVNCVVGPLASDSSTYTYFLTDNHLFQNLNSTDFFSPTISPVPPSGIINALSMRFLIVVTDICILVQRPVNYGKMLPAVNLSSPDMILAHQLLATLLN